MTGTRLRIELRSMGSPVEYQNHPLVVNIHHNQPFDVRIGRAKSPFHWGNPFSHLKNSLAAILLPSRELACEAFDAWLDGIAYREVEPERREWILRNLHLLKGKRLGCFCHPARCHGSSLARRAESAKEPILIGMLDSDLVAMSRNDLVSEIMKLRAGVRQHRDCSGHELCWYHPELWSLLPEKTDPKPQIPSTEEFIANCKKFRETLDESRG